MGVVVYTTQAFFSDEEKSVDNTFVAGEFDLKVDNTCYYNGLACLPVLGPDDKPLGYSTWTQSNPRNAGDLNGDICTCTWGLKDLAEGDLFFDFQDLKPDDESEDTISLHVKNDAYACMSITKTADDDVDCTEPELLDDPSCTLPGVGQGELGELLHFIFWADDGDNVLEDNEAVIKEGLAKDLFVGKIWTLADSLNNIWSGQGPMIGDTPYYIGKAWCYGTLTQTPVAAGQGVDPTVASGVTCDGTALNNASQTDKFMADVEFSAVQARHNGGFVCNECEKFGVGYTNFVYDSDQGTTKSGGAILPARVNPNNAVGLPDWPPGTGDNFFSLGVNGWIILAFNNPVKDGPGDDLSFHEATNGRPGYPLESALVEVSLDGVNWYSLGNVGSEPAGDGVEYKDFSSTGLSYVKYVRLTDNTNYGPHVSDADGYDLDAVDGVYAVCLDDVE